MILIWVFRTWLCDKVRVQMITWLYYKVEHKALTRVCRWSLTGVCVCRWSLTGVCVCVGDHSPVCVPVITHSCVCVCVCRWSLTGVCVCADDHSPVCVPVNTHPCVFVIRWTGTTCLRCCACSRWVRGVKVGEQAPPPPSPPWTCPSPRHRQPDTRYINQNNLTKCIIYY